MESSGEYAVAGGHDLITATQPQTENLLAVSDPAVITDELQSDLSDSLSETSSEPSVKVNPAFKRVISNPKDLLPSAPFKKIPSSNESKRLNEGGAASEDASKLPRSAAGTSNTISRHNNSNVEMFMKDSLVQWVAAAINQIYNGRSQQGSVVPMTPTGPKESQGDGNCPDPGFTFQELVDGILLNDLMYDIHPSIACKAGIQADVEEQPHLRLQNLALLLRNIRFYHSEVLGEALVGRLPDVTAIARDPSSVMGLAELKRVLQMLLGCAMKSEEPVRKRHVAIIQSFPETEQRELMQYIQEAKSQMNAVSLAEVQEMVNEEFQSIFHQLVDDRFDLFEVCNSQAVEQLSNFGASGALTDAYGNALSQTSPQINGGGLFKRGSYHSRQGSNYGELQQLNLQVADLKSRLHKKDNELLQKDEDLENFSVENMNLSQENKRLKDQLNEAAREARHVRGLRDELDIFREKAARADRAESELEMARHKLEELDYYRQRLEQSNKDYKMLEQTKSSIEKHNEALERQLVDLHDTMRVNISLQSQIDGLESLVEEKERICESLKGENESLKVQNTVSLNESASLHQQLVNANYSQTSHRPSVGSECEDSLKFSMIQLEKEKQDYKTKAIELETKLMQLSRDKSALEKEFEKTKASVSKEKSSIEELQQSLEKASNDKKTLHATMEQLQKSHNSEVLSLKEEVESLTQNLESSRRQQANLNDSNVDAQLKESQEQNIVLHARVQEFMSKCNQLESEKRQMQRKLEILQEEVTQSSTNETKLQQLSKEFDQMKLSLDEEKLKSANLEKVESENLTLQMELTKIKGKLDLNKNTESKFDELKKENVQLKAQNQKLAKSAENLSALTQKINQLELENSEKQREIDTLQHVIQVNKSELSRATELEARNQSLNSDIQKLRKTLEMYSEKEREKGDELSSLQLEKESVQRELDTMRVNNESLESKMKEYQTLDADNCQLVKDKRQLERNIERLKRDIEEYETKDQDQRSKLAVMERELKRTQRFTERDLGKDEQIQDLKNENAELRKQSMLDKKTNNTLREELVNEKLKHQDLQSEMEKLKGDLADKETSWKLQQHKNLLSSSSTSNSPNSSFVAAQTGNLLVSNSLLDVKDKRIKELESLLAQKSAEKDTIQQELEVLKKQLPKIAPSSHTSQGIGGLVLPGLDDLYWESKFNALDREHVRARERIESLSQQLDNRQTEMNELLSVKYRHEGQIEAYRKQLQKTHAETANIQVELSTLRSENASLKTQIVDEQSKGSRIEHQLSVRTKELEQCQCEYEQLLQGNEMLQALHSNLSHDYEDRMSQFTQLKSEHKKLSNFNRELLDKYEVLKSEKEVLEKQNSSLKGQRDALMSSESGAASIIELEEREQNLKVANSNLKMMNATLMEAFEKLKKERDATDSKRTEVRQLQRENSELRSQVANVHSFSEQLETQNAKLKYDYELLRSHNDQLSQMCIEYDQLHEQLRSRQSRSRNTASTSDHKSSLEQPHTVSKTLAPSLDSETRLIPEQESAECKVKTPSLEHLDSSNVKMRERFRDIQSQQRRLYENSAFVTATLPRSTATGIDSPSMHRKKGPNLIKQLKKSLSKSGSFSRDSHPKLSVTTQRRNSRDDDSVSAERNNDSSSFGSRSDTANDSPRLIKRYSQFEDSVEATETRPLSAVPQNVASTSSAGLPEEYATLSRKTRSKKDKEKSPGAKNKLLSKFSSGTSASRNASKECLLDSSIHENFPNISYSQAPRKSLPDVAYLRVSESHDDNRTQNGEKSGTLRAFNGTSNGVHGGYMSPGDSSSVAESSSSAKKGRRISQLRLLRPQSCIGKKTSKLKRNRQSTKSKLESSGSFYGGILLPPTDETPAGSTGGTLKQSRSHPNLRDMISRISTSINPGSSSNLAASFRNKNRKREKYPSNSIHRTGSLDRSKSPALSITIPPSNAFEIRPEDNLKVTPRRRTPGSGSAHSGDRPKSAVTPIGSSSLAAMGTMNPDDIDDKISLEQFLKESNRSPKSRRKYQEAVLNNDKDALREHLSCDELEDEFDGQKSPPNVRNVVRQHTRSQLNSRNPHTQHRLSQPSPDSTFRSDVEGGGGSSLSGSLGHSPQFAKLMGSRMHSPQSRYNLPTSNIPLTRSYHGNLSGSSIGSDLPDRDGCTQGDASPLKYTSPYGQPNLARPGSRSGIVGTSTQNPNQSSVDSTNYPQKAPRSQSKLATTSASLQKSHASSTRRSSQTQLYAVSSDPQSSDNTSSLAVNRQMNPVSTNQNVPQLESQSNSTSSANDVVTTSASSDSKDSTAKKNTAVWYEYGCV